MSDKPPKVKIWLTTDNHFHHKNIVEHGHRAVDHEEQQLKHWRAMVKPHDIVFCLGDFSLGKSAEIIERVTSLPGRKFLVLGNHDSHTALWYMNNGFDFAAEGILYRDIYFTHIPITVLPPGARLNVHGHLHDSPPSRHGHVPQDFHKLLAIESTGYKPVELDRFLTS